MLAPIKTCSKIFILQNCISWTLGYKDERCVWAYLIIFRFLFLSKAVLSLFGPFTCQKLSETRPFQLCSHAHTLPVGVALSQSPTETSAHYSLFNSHSWERSDRQCAAFNAPFGTPSFVCNTANSNEYFETFNFPQLHPSSGPYFTKVANTALATHKVLCLSKRPCSSSSQFVELNDTNYSKIEAL